jgi:hypothetical protein
MLTGLPAASQLSQQDPIVFQRNGARGGLIALRTTKYSADPSEQ